MYQYMKLPTRRWRYHYLVIMGIAIVLNGQIEKKDLKKIIRGGVFFRHLYFVYSSVPNKGGTMAIYFELKISQKWPKSCIFM